MLNLTSFSIARLPQIEFGCGKAKIIPELIQRYGAHFLLVTGAKSIEQNDYWNYFIDHCNKLKLSFNHVRIENEPSPQLIDNIVQEHKAGKHQCIVALGGGSVLDAGKAIAGLLTTGHSVTDYLEGVGPELDYHGPALPFIAAPTTAGTGSEATKNSVLSMHGENGYKKSFRHSQLVPDFAIVDPDLLIHCPKDLIAANGMDALTQLMESYVSTNANPMTDALAIDGLKAIQQGLLNWYHGTGNQSIARTQMAYASLLSGICLAQTGLGAVHGLASPLGAFFPIPHGVVCGTLVATTTDINLKALNQQIPNQPKLSLYQEKYQHIGRILNNNDNLAAADAAKQLVTLLTRWTTDLNLPRLSHYNVKVSDYSRIIANCRGSSMKTNPIVLSDQEIEAILSARQ